MQNNNFSLTDNRLNLFTKRGIAVATLVMLPLGSVVAGSKTPVCSAKASANKSVVTKKVTRPANVKSFSLQNVSDAALMQEVARRFNNGASRRGTMQRPVVNPRIMPSRPSPVYGMGPVWINQGQAMRMFEQEIRQMQRRMAMMLSQQQAAPQFMPAPPQFSGNSWGNLANVGMANVRFYSVDAKPDKIIIKLKLPKGADQSMMKATIKNNILQVSGKMERVTETKDANKNVFMKSQSIENFQRSLMLPKDIIATKMTTKSSNGFFTVTIPRQKNLKHKKS